MATSPCGRPIPRVRQSQHRRAHRRQRLQHPGPGRSRWEYRPCRARRSACSTGREQIAHFIAVEFGKLFCADVKVDFRGVNAEDDVVIVEERMQATLSNGHHHDVDYCFIFELRDGLIARVRELMHTLKGARMVFGSLDRVPAA